jgi:hypothetical protein
MKCFRLCILSFLVLCPLCFLGLSTTHVLLQTYFELLYKMFPSTYLIMGFLLYTEMTMLWYYFVLASTTIKLCFQWLNTTTTILRVTCFSHKLNIHASLPYNKTMITMFGTKISMLQQQQNCFSKCDYMAS